MPKVIVYTAAVAAFLCAVLVSSPPAFARHGATPTPAPKMSVLPYARIAINTLERVPIGSEIEVVGYFSHKSPEIDGDLEVYLIDHHGYFVIVEAPKRYRDMKYYIRSLHLHRNDVVVVRGTLTQQHDKPTTHYVNGWLEINPVETITRYAGPLPQDLHYVRVVHHMFGKARITYI